MIKYRLLGWSGVALRMPFLRLVLCLASLGVCACVSSRGSTDGGADAVRRDTGKDVLLPEVCREKGGTPTKGKGESCACDNECRTGHCVDGVCCTSACDERCKSCGLPSALGDCDFVPAGAPPTDLSECGEETPRSCGQDGMCDGKGGCELYVPGTVCDYGKCDGDGLSGVKNCDGKGTCSGNLSQPCGSFSCDSALEECRRSCLTDSQCALGHECSSSSRRCSMQLNGYKCESDDECASGHCSGGYCCNSACDKPCFSCALPGSYGSCRVVPAGQRVSGCPAQDPSTCGTTGYCNASGTCAYWPADTTPCLTSSCAGPVLLNTAAVCDGRGTCGAPALIDCSPYRCVTGACNTTCKTDADCEEGHICKLDSSGRSGTCGKRQNGQSCGDAGDCNSGHCVDGVCCENSCEGLCRSCSLPGSPGRCVSLPAGARDPSCTDEGTASCGHNGLCDGNGACQSYPVGTRCGDPSCEQHSFVDAPTCNQSGQCVAPPSRSCAPYVCNGKACFGSCTKDSDCLSPATCVNGFCGTKPLGAECSSAKECNSGFCAQGICCNFACSESCKACNLAGTLGLCTAVSDGSPDPQDKCETTAPSSCGTTGACRGGTCAYHDSQTVCEAASCADPYSQKAAATCDGKGTCAPADAHTCAPYICSDHGCLSSCKDDNDCASLDTCLNGSCGKKSNGAACASGAECGSGFCTEGVCCNNTCADANLCMSCKVNGKVGTCSPVPDGQADPKQRCVASDAASGDCSSDGTCNGRGGCRPWSASVGCRAASCTGDSFTPAANCDGAGGCSVSTTLTCDPYVCSSTGCLTVCASDADCVTGKTCLETERHCSKYPNGHTCAANDDCNSNVCTSEGVCCDVVCDGACKSCSLESKVGTCSNIAAGEPCGVAGCADPMSSGAVSESVAQIPAPMCDGQGACQAQAPVSCGAYQCDASTKKCKEGSCSSTDTDCNALPPTTSNPTGGNSCVAGICQRQPKGATCDVASPWVCESNYCVDGVCCEAASCDDGVACTTDTCSSDGTCSHTWPSNNCLIDGACQPEGKLNPEGACEKCDPTQSRTAWSLRNEGEVCDAAAEDSCYADAECTGSSRDCPAKGSALATKVCREAAGTCDIAELCDGTSTVCPPDALSGAGTSCRAAGNLCEEPATCTGDSAACPATNPVKSCPEGQACDPGTGSCV